MAVVFLDTETTGVHADRRPWEIAIIRRERSGTENAITVFVHTEDLDLDNADPRGLEIGQFYQRHPSYGAPLQTDQVHVGEAEAAHLVHTWMTAASVYGVNTSFDTETLAPMLHRHGLAPSWYYFPHCMSVFAAGYVRGRGEVPARSSEKLSEQCGVEPPTFDRHTAMGDARWVCRWYDMLDVAGVLVA